MKYLFSHVLPTCWWCVTVFIPKILTAVPVVKFRKCCLFNLKNQTQPTCKCWALCSSFTVQLISTDYHGCLNGDFDIYIYSFSKRFYPMQLLLFICLYIFSIIQWQKCSFSIFLGTYSQTCASHFPSVSFFNWKVVSPLLVDEWVLHVCNLIFRQYGNSF